MGYKIYNRLKKQEQESESLDEEDENDSESESSECFVERLAKKAWTSVDVDIDIINIDSGIKSVASNRPTVLVTTEETEKGNEELVLYFVNLPSSRTSNYGKAIAEYIKQDNEIKEITRFTPKRCRPTVLVDLIIGSKGEEYHERRELDPALYEDLGNTLYLFKGCETGELFPEVAQIVKDWAIQWVDEDESIEISKISLVTKVSLQIKDAGIGISVNEAVSLLRKITENVFVYEKKKLEFRHVLFMVPDNLEYSYGTTFYDCEGPLKLKGYNTRNGEIFQYQ